MLTNTQRLPSVTNGIKSGGDRLIGWIEINVYLAFAGSVAADPEE